MTILAAGTPLRNGSRTCRMAPTCGFDLTDDEWPLRGFLVRVGDDVHAYVNRCPHAGRPLNFMPDRFLTPDGELIHVHRAWRAVREGARGCALPGRAWMTSLRRIPVRVDDGEVRLAEDLDRTAWRRRPGSRAQSDRSRSRSVPDRHSEPRAGPASCRRRRVVAATRCHRRGRRRAAHLRAVRRGRVNPRDCG